MSPPGWVWTPDQSGPFYTILGVFLILAAGRDPFEHRGLIWFTVRSSAAHAASCWSRPWLTKASVAV
ncbi:MAG TPA: DUF6632 domain-containing protein [Alphaproteobacteria bacterium]|nr:DUF6632 domain-containing protein [Alphaproteobacteria bacterium]